MNEEFRQLVIETLRRGQDLPREWARELFPPEKREYVLEYQDKAREEDILAETMAVPLQSVRAFGGNGDDGWRNMLIFGDNLQVLKTLVEQKKEGQLRNADGTPGARLAYIDPPFATKQDFQGAREEKVYRDKIAGAEFVELIRKRLVLLRELLSPDGSIFVHVDYRKAHYIKVVLDELLGEHNYRNEIILPGRASKNLQQQFDEVSRLNVRHDTLFWYSASSATRFSPLWIEKHKQSSPEGHWHHFWSTADRPTMRYELFGFTPSAGQWTWEESKAKQAIRNYERYQQEGGGRSLAEYWRDTGCALKFVRQDPEDGKPLYWRPPSRLRLADTIWSGIPIYSNTAGYPTEKNEALLSQVIELASSPGDLVLDAFAGSGTTCAVAEKLGRRWIGIDCGKLAIYTVQKRLLNLRVEIGNKGKSLPPRPFTLYNAGLYDFATLRQLPWGDWRFFALQLFECKDEPHTVGGVRFDGKRQGANVLVFNHLEHPDARIDESTVASIHHSIGQRVGERVYIIAPRAMFDFQQDYLTFDDVRYYALRIPYSFINELHRGEFTPLQQPRDETAVNEIMDAVGFDFNRTPQVTWAAGNGTCEGQLVPEAYLEVQAFESQAYIRGKGTRGGLETFSMLMLDFDYDDDTQVFNLGAVWYAHQLEAAGWRAWFPLEGLGENVMAVFIDIYGNEARELIPRARFE